jgi:hypothetical protein
LDLIEGIIKKTFYRQIFTFSIYFIISLFVYTIRPPTPGVLCQNATNLTNGNSTLAMMATTLTTLEDAQVLQELFETTLSDDYTDGMEISTSSPLEGKIDKFTLQTQQHWCIGCSPCIGKLRALVTDICRATSAT